MTYAAIHEKRRVALAKEREKAAKARDKLVRRARREASLAKSIAQTVLLKRLGSKMSTSTPKDKVWVRLFWPGVHIREVRQ
jgi:hypothetical protein